MFAAADAAGDISAMGALFFGTLHLGIGKGITFGSTIRAVGPIDLVIRLPIVEVDGKGVLKERYVPV